MPAFTPDPNSLEASRRRVRYRASHRGTKELDLILGGFADERAMDFDSEMVARFEALLNFEEMQLQGWLIGGETIPDEADAQLIGQIIQFQREKVGISVPETDR